MSQPSMDSTLLLWAINPDSYVRPVKHFVWRIKPVSKFGEGINGLPESKGDLFEVQWHTVLKMKPTTIEINNVRSPLTEFVNGIKSADETSVSEFLSKLSTVSVNKSDINVKDLLDFFSNINLLAGFSAVDDQFAEDGWDMIATELARLNVRALNITSNIQNKVFSKLNIELAVLGKPGISDSLKDYPTVKTLVAQDLGSCETNDIASIERDLASVLYRFPNLKSLVWDWNVVDPLLEWNKRTTDILDIIADRFKTLKLGLLAIILYTPCAETKAISTKVSDHLCECGVSSVTLERFCTKGIEHLSPNFTLITAGENAHRRRIIRDIFITNNTPSPNLSSLLPLLSDGPEVYTGTPTVIDFGGFDRKYVKNALNQKASYEEVDAFQK